MKKIITIIGARPQFIKAAPVSKAFNKKNINEIIVHTGQHYDSDLSDVFFDELETLKPAYNCEVGSSSHAVQTGEMMKRLEPILIDEHPAMICIYGDTNSTLAGALTAAKLHIPVAHVESGLRSFNQKMPEEINRIVADRLSSLLFAPTKTAVENLRKEGITEGVHKTGDVMYDVALQFSKKAEKQSTILKKNGIKPKEYILSTVHRQENTDNKKRLTNIFNALNAIARDIPVIVPLHPRTRKMLNDSKLNESLSNCTIIDPVGFLDMIALESHAQVIITDSGGIQKESYFHQVPCVTLRDETEWLETVHAGWNTLANVSSPHNIITLVQNIIESKGTRKRIDEYGNGKASEQIAEILYAAI